MTNEPTPVELDAKLNKLEDRVDELQNQQQELVDTLISELSVKPNPLEYIEIYGESPPDIDGLSPGEKAGNETDSLGE